jgi:endonuclease/exonuclease/phosphatase family metal-dependent hydrolase
LGQNANDSKRRLGRLGRKPAILLTAIALVALAAPAAADAKKKGKGAPKVTVMTRNIYLGADLAPALTADSLAEAIDANGQILAEVDETNFPERAVPLAKELKEAKPDLVGLQEVALWRQQGPSDLPPEFGGTEATEVRYDFLQLLLDQLKGSGPKYNVVHIQDEFDQELPVDVDQSDATGGLNGADIDGRLTMRDVILAKKGGKVKTGKTNAAHYTTLYEPTVGGVPLDVERGWQSVEAKVAPKGKKGGGKSKFRFINTHLEAFGDPTIREAQALELIAGPANTNKQVILVGDVNSGLQAQHATGSYQFQPGDPLAFEAFAAAGFKDNGAKQPNNSYPQTCCGDPRNPTLVFDHTVDHVLTRPGLKTLKAFATGNDPDQRTPSGLWPSDHGGKVVKLQLKK